MGNFVVMALYRDTSECGNVVVMISRRVCCMIKQAREDG